MFDELELDFACISETRMTLNDRTEKNVKKLSDRDSLQIIRKDRKSRGGGVAIVFDTRRIRLKQVKINAPGI